MSVDPVKFLAALQQFNLLKELENPERWKVSSGPPNNMHNQPVSGVDIGMHGLTTLSAKYTFAENGATDTVAASQDFRNKNKESISFDDKPVEIPHVSVRPTSQGSDVALIVKTSFSVEDQARMYRFDWHYPVPLEVLIELISKL